VSEPTSTSYFFESFPVQGSSLRRWFYLGVGWTGFALGVVGAVLPIAPAMPFFLASAWGFSKSSPELEAWLLRHPWVGPGLARFRRHRVLPRTFKLISVGSMVLGFAFSLAIPAVPLWARWMQAAFVVIGSAFVLQFPSRVPSSELVQPVSGKTL
jgi:uncharacterized protein